MSTNSIDRVEIKCKAKSILEGNWPLCIGVTLIYFLLIFLADHFIGFSAGFGVILNLLIATALSLSLVAFFVNSIKTSFFSLIHLKFSIKSYFKMIIFTFLISLSFIPYGIFLGCYFFTSNFLWLILSLIGIFFAVYVSLVFFAVPYILIENDGNTNLIDSMVRLVARQR